jgi:hypothetical protein
LGAAAALHPAPTSPAATAADPFKGMITADQAAATILLLVPGFLALKVFARYGLRSRWSDLEWVLWSLVAAGVIGAATDFAGLMGGIRVAVSLALGALLGVVLAAGWRRWVRGRPEREYAVQARAWPVLAGADWVLLELPGQRRLVGHPSIVTDPADSDELDLYLSEPAWVGEDGSYDDAGVEGMWIPASSIIYAQVLGRPVTRD